MSKTSSYTGVIEIIKINNPLLENNVNNSIRPMTDSNIMFVHYPDCQQLILWLPEYKSMYDSISIIDERQNIVYKEKIESVVSGSTQIIIDSIFIKPGRYCIQLLISTGHVHEIEFLKYKAGETIPEKNPENIEIENKVEGSIVYKDGFGNVIKNNDTEWRNIYY